MNRRAFMGALAALAAGCGFRVRKPEPPKPKCEWHADRLVLYVTTEAKSDLQVHIWAMREGGGPVRIADTIRPEGELKVIGHHNGVPILGMERFST